MRDVATNLGVEVRSIDTIVDCDTSIRSILQQRSLPYRFRVVEGILLRGETTSWHGMDAGGRIHLTINQLWAWASCGCAFRECTSTRHTREENTVTFTANNNKNGRGNAEEGNCDDWFRCGVFRPSICPSLQSRGDMLIRIDKR